MRAFRGVAEQGNFTRAAERVHLTQPGVTMHIKNLERELGQVLFVRGKQRTHLTEAGKILYRHVRHIMDIQETAYQQLEQLDGLARGQITLACSDTFAAYLLGDLISEFTRAYPAIAIHLLNRTSPEIGELVRGHEVDIGFLSLPVDTAGLVVTEFFHYRDVAISLQDGTEAPRARVRLGDLAQNRLLLLERETRTRMLLESQLDSEGVALRSVMELGSVEVQKRFARLGLGVAVVPDYAVASELASGALYASAVENLEKRRVGMVIRETRTLSAAARAFIHLAGGSGIRRPH